MSDTITIRCPFKKSLLFIILCGTCLMLDSCSAIRDLTSNIKKPSLSVTNVRVTGFNFQEMELTYDVTVDNPNAVSVQMLNYDYDLKINNSSLVRGEQAEKMEIESSGKSTFQVPMTLNFKDMYAAISSLVNKDEADYNFLSTVAFNVPVLGRTEIPVKKEGTIPLPKAPKISLKNLEVENLSFTRADLKLNMEIDNPNAFGLIVNNFRYDLNINDSDWAQGNAFKDLKLTKKGTTQLEIPISLNIAQIGMSAYRILNGSEQLDYNLTSDFKFGTTHPLLGQTSFNFDRSGKISLSK